MSKNIDGKSAGSRIESDKGQRNSRDVTLHIRWEGHPFNRVTVKATIKGLNAGRNLRGKSGVS